jgi:hypothetical protein
MTNENQMSIEDFRLRREPSIEFKPVRVPRGLYKARVAKLRKVPGFEGVGEALVIGFKIKVDNKDEIVEGMASLSLHEKSKFTKWVSSIDPKLIPEVGEEMRLGDLMGKECQVLTDDKEKVDKRDGSKYIQSFVKEVLPL